MAMRSLLLGNNVAKTLIFMGKKRLLEEQEWVLKIAKRITRHQQIIKTLQERKENKHIDYSLQGNCIMMRTYDKDMDKNLNWKARNSCF